VTQAPLSPAGARHDAVAIACGAVDAIDLRRATRDALEGADPPSFVIAIGKGAPAMARGARDAFGEALGRLLVVTTDGTDVTGLAGQEGADVLFAAHPVPDRRSALAAQAALGGAAQVRASRGTLLALISGGASSLVCAPTEGLPLDAKRAVVADLLASGAPIDDVNLVRRHLSRIQGGGLARAALFGLGKPGAPAGQVRALIASDVLTPGARDDAAWIVGSGPAVPDPSAIEAARAAVARWAPRWSVLPDAAWTTQLPVGSAGCERVSARVIAAPEDLAWHAAHRAERAGYAVRVLPASGGTVDELAASYASLARDLSPGEALIRVAEPRVLLPARTGRGGRATRLSLSTWVRGLPDDVALACLASDGVDGASGLAGGVVRGGLSGLDADEARAALAAFDDAPFLEAHGAAIAQQPSGKNQLDVHVLLRHR
jgi:hydroxypyruvate reductase